MTVRRKHNAGAGVGVARDPGAVDGKQHQYHHERHDDDALYVHTDAFLRRLVFFSLLHLTDPHLTAAITTALTTNGTVILTRSSQEFTQ